MSTYDPSALLALCDSILEDGELSTSEVYHLAEWLNSDREACFHWPGNLLVKPLQDVWADGEVDVAELRLIGRILSEIHRTWVKRQVPPKTYHLEQPTIDLSKPRLPTVDFSCRINSYSNPETAYDVNLNRAASRKQFPISKALLALKQAG